MIWELGLSCGLVFVGHARTLYRTWRVNSAEDADEPEPAAYDGPLVDPPKVEFTRLAAGRCECDSCTRNRRENYDLRKIERDRLDAARQRAKAKDDEWAKETADALDRLIEEDLKRPQRRYNTIFLPNDSPTLNPIPLTVAQLTGMSREELAARGYLPDGSFYTSEKARVEAIRGNPQAMYLDAMHGMLTSHTCRTCGYTSYNPNDVKYKYCGKCHHFCQDSGERFT